MGFEYFPQYLLTFMIIFCNVASGVYVYPIFIDALFKSDENLDFCSITLYFGIMIFSYEFGKLINNFLFGLFITTQSNRKVLVISLILISIFNIFLGISGGFYLIIVFRFMIGLVNSLNQTSKRYLFQIFPVKLHQTIVKFLILFTNIGSILGFLIGYTGCTSLLNNSQINLSLKFGLNNYYFCFISFSLICLATIIIVCFFGKVINYPENVDINSSTPHQQKNENVFTLRTNSSVKKPSLVLFDKDSSVRKETSSNNIEQIIEKDENEQDFSDRKDCKSIDKAIKNNGSQSSSTDNNKNNENEGENDRCEIIETNPSKFNSIIINNNININLHSKPYFQISNINESKLNNSDNKMSSRAINHGNENTENMPDKIFFTIENNINSVHDKKNFKEMTNFSINSKKKDGDIQITSNRKKKEIPSTSSIINNIIVNKYKINTDDQQKKIEVQNKQNNLKDLVDSKKEEKGGLTVNQDKIKSGLVNDLNLKNESLKISLIFTFFQLSDIILQNVFISSLYNKNVFYLNSSNISLVFMSLQFIYTFFSFFSFVYLQNIEDKKKLGFFLRISIIILIIIAIVFPFILKQGIKFLFISILLILSKNVCVSVSINIYDILNSKIENLKLRLRISSLHKTSNIFKICLGFVTFLIISLVKIDEFYVNLSLCLSSGIFVILSALLLRGFEKNHI